MLAVNGLITHRRRVRVLEGVNLKVSRGEFVAVIGPNGAGKSTLFGALMGFYRASAGSISFREQEITARSVEERVRLGITLVPERRQIFNGLSVEDNLYLGAYSWSSKQPQQVKTRIESVYGLFGALKDKRMASAGSLSGGQQQMLAIGRALMARPDLILLDEPTLGLAPLVIRDILESLRKLCDQGVTMLLAEQNAKAAFRVSDRVYVLERGRVVLETTPEEARQDTRVRQAYLGG